MRGTRGKGKFTHAQREAIYALTSQPDTTHEQAAEILNTVGYGRLPPFSISHASVYRIARELRATRAPDGVDLSHAEPVKAVDRMLADLIKIAQRQLARLESDEANGRLEPKQISTFAGVLRDLRAQATKTQPTAPNPLSEAQNDGDEERSETDWLGAEDRDPTGDTSVSPPTTETEHAETHDHVPTHKGSESDLTNDQPIPIEHANTQPLEPTHSA